MIGKIRITSSDYDPEQGKNAKDPYLGPDAFKNAVARIATLERLIETKNAALRIIADDDVWIDREWGTFPGPKWKEVDPLRGIAQAALDAKEEPQDDPQG